MTFIIMAFSITIKNDTVSISTFKTLCVITFYVSNL
jgi:hypothetical protein